ncbi:MAG: Uma2 family endonuclease [Bacteroidota bacterium]
MEVFKMLPEGTLAEVIENALYMSPTPTGKHQRLSRKLSTQLDQFVTSEDLGEIFYAPYDVFLDETENAVQPDLFFVSRKNAGIVNDDGHVHGVPDLIIEILSPGNKKHDKVIKKNLYEKFGVKEYWIIDPDTRAAIGYTLKNKTYQLIGEDSGKINSILLGKSFVF